MALSINRGSFFFKNVCASPTIKALKPLESKT